MQELLSSLLKKGVRLTASTEGELKIQTGAEPLSDAEKTAIKQHKAELLAFLAGGKAACLSYSQERLWFLAQMGYGSQYHVPGLAKITGPLSQAALQQALDYLIVRHESLRTNFIAIADSAAQLIAQAKPVSLEYVDLSTMPPAQQNAEQKRLQQSFIDRPFDLAADSLFRAMLIKRSESEHTLVICMHHIVTDGWSMRLLLRDLTGAYEAFSVGQNPTAAPLSIDYASYAAWERGAMDDALMASELDYWRGQLEGYSNLDLPLDFVRPAQSSGRGAYLHIELDADFNDAVKETSRAFRTTSFSLFMACVYTLLKKYSQQSDICLGMPVANRHQREMEDIVGFFVNTVVMRINPDSANQTVAELISHVHKVIVDGQDHQNLPIEKILQVLQPERDLSRSPIFQILINYTPLNLGQVPFGDCVLEPEFDFEIDSAKFDITFTYQEIDGGKASIGIEYATELFRADTIERMAGQLSRLMAYFAGHCDAQINSFDWLPETEAISQVWEHKASDYPTTVCWHELFARQVKQSPSAMALIYEDQRLTYQELHEQSGQVAVYLQGIGIGPETIVALSISRSPAMIVGVLGILKAGAAYLPIDAELPKERIKSLLSDSACRYLLTEQAVLGRLAGILADTAIEARCLDSDWPAIVDARGELQSLATPDNLAYVIYTSGSTGQPKGVMIEHKSLVNHNLAVIDAYQMTASDRVMQFSTISFDIFVEEVFPTLLCGGAVVLLDAQRFTDVAYLKAVIRRHQVSVMNLPTAFWHSVVHESFPESLSRVIIGGEKAEIDKYQIWRRTNPTVRVTNTYGPTEATVITLLYPLPDILPADRQIPLGKPLANTQVAILDADLKPLPIGIPGELYIAGAGLARGYLNAPELDAQKFIPNPWLAGDRLYKTGDLTRYLADGQIEYLGRMDSQVKIRGFRIELGEIESALEAYPGIQNAIVIVGKQSANKQLIGFYVPAAGSQIDHDAMKMFLRDRLPDYMIPVHFVALEKMPLTANGKVNRNGLAQYFIPANTDTNALKPESALEIGLAEIWQKLLNVPTVNANDNFFELGGHSLLTVQLISQTQQLGLGKRLTPADIFKYPTVKSLAAYLEDNVMLMSSPSQKAPLSPHVVSLRTARPTFIVPGLPGLSDGYYQLAERLGLDGEVYGLQMRGFETQESPATTVADMAAHNIDLIRQFCTGGKINLYAHSYGGTVVYEMLRQLQDSEFEVGEVVFIDSGVLKPRQSAIDKASVRTFCQFLLATTGAEQKVLENQIKDILDSHEQAEWQHQLAALMQQSGAMDGEQFSKIWRVVEAAVSVNYRYGENGEKLPQRLTLVVADGSKGWLNKNCWDPYFEQVRVISTPGDHMSIVRQPDCDPWLKQLAGSGELAASAGGLAEWDPSHVLRIDNLRKQYKGKGKNKDNVVAVENLSFALTEGVCFGLLGPNGAGKTTTLEMLEGISKPSSGAIYYRGAPIGADYRKRIGIQFQHTALPELLTVKESLQLFQKLYPSSLDIDELIAACALEEYLNRDNRKLSGGQRQRLLLAIALINDPDIVFLDEPTTGLDPQARHNFWDLLRSVKARGKTIVLTTHYMDEAENLCDEIAIMDKGKILVQDTPQNLLKNHFDGVLIKLPLNSGLADCPDWPYPLYTSADKVEFITPDVESALRHLAERHIPLEGLSVLTPNLENLFLKLTGYSLRD